MTKSHAASLAALVLAAAGLAGGCAGDASVATEMGIPEVYTHQEAAAEAAAMTDALDGPDVTRSVEAGVTVIRGLSPSQLQAFAASAPTGEAGAATDAAAAGAAPAPGALVDPDQLAMLAAPTAVPVTPVAGRALGAQLAPAAGSAQGRPQLAAVQLETELAPVSIEVLEARGAERLTTEEIEALSVGNTITHTNAETGFTVSTYYHPGGESRLINGDRGLPSRYQIGDGMRCRIDMQGVGVCALLYRDGPTTWICEQGEEGICSWYISKIEPGYILG